MGENVASELSQIERASMLALLPSAAGSLTPGGPTAGRELAQTLSR